MNLDPKMPLLTEEGEILSMRLMGKIKQTLTHADKVNPSGASRPEIDELVDHVYMRIYEPLTTLGAVLGTLDLWAQGRCGELTEGEVVITNGNLGARAIVKIIEMIEALEVEEEPR